LVSYRFREAERRTDHSRVTRLFCNAAPIVRGRPPGMKAWSKTMKVEFVPGDSVTEPRHWVRHDQAFAMMVGPGSIDWGSKRSALEKLDYAAGDLDLCDRHVGEWVGLMTVPQLQLGVSDAALMASADGAYGDVELRASRKFADARLSALVALAHAEMAAGFP